MRLAPRPLLAAFAGAPSVGGDEPVTSRVHPALNLPEHLEGRALLRSSRDASSSPAVGTHKVHELEQKALVEAAFA